MFVLITIKVRFRPSDKYCRLRRVADEAGHDPCPGYCIWLAGQGDYHGRYQQEVSVASEGMPNHCILVAGLLISIDTPTS
jgi:hypothetical protein